jgi:hypothetical protein
MTNVRRAIRRKFPIKFETSIHPKTSLPSNRSTSNAAETNDTQCYLASYLLLAMNKFDEVTRRLHENYCSIAAFNGTARRLFKESDGRQTSFANRRRAG